MERLSLRLYRLLIVLLFVLSVCASPGTAQAAHSAAGSPGLLQFFAGGHEIGFAPGKVYLAGLDHGLTMEFAGGQPVAPLAEAAASKNGMGATPLLGRVAYTHVWPGVDVVYTSAPGGVVESTYLLDPGANPAAITLRYNTPVALMKDGSLRFSFESGWMGENAPLAWQDVAGRRRPVSVHFVQKGEREIGFSLGAHDPTRAVTIDPTYIWHTFYGSAAGFDFGMSIALDGSGNIYVVGWSSATWDGPGGIAPLNPYAGGEDIVIVKLSNAGTYQWHTFYGSAANNDEGTGIALDASGNVYVAGVSYAPWTGPGGVAPLHAYTGANQEIMVLKLTSAGAYQWHTFYGGANLDAAHGIALDAAANVYVTGLSFTTWTGPGPTPPLHAFGGFVDIVVLKLTSAGAYQWHTFYGSASDDQGTAIAVDGGGNVYVTGHSFLTWNGPGAIPPLNPIAGGQDIVVLKLNSAGAYQWHTFYGTAAGTDQGDSIVVDGSGGVYVAGISADTWNGPGAILPLNAEAGSFDMVALKLNTAGAYQWHTFYGSTGFDFGNAIAVDNSGTIYLTGYSPASWNGPGAVPPLYPYSGGSDIVLVKLSSTGAYQRHAFYGSTNSEDAYAITTDPAGDIYLTGVSPASWDGPGPTPPLNPYAGSQDITVIRLDNDTTPPTVTSSVPFDGAVLVTGPTQITVNYSEDVFHDGSANAADATANYLLVEQGANAAFDTLSCSAGVQSDDVAQGIASISYNNNARSGPFTATLTLGAALLPGHYRLLVCGANPSIKDLAMNPLNGGSDSTVTFTVLPPDTTPPIVISSTPANGATLATGPSQITVDYSEDVIHDGSANAADAIANYLLVERGTNAVFDTLSCAGGLQSDDVSQAITGAAYTNTGGMGPFTATLTLAAALPPGHYRLLVCGTNPSIKDLAMNPLNGGADSPITFTVATPDTTPPTVVSSIPANGALLGTGPTQITVNYSEDVIHDGSANAANTIANYLLVEAGANTVFDTLTCAGGRQSDDVLQVITGAAYTNTGGVGPFTATLTLTAALLPGHYRLLVCGTTSIEDLAFNKLNGGADSSITFTVLPPDTTPPTVISSIPANGALLATGPTQITVNFSEDVLNDGSANAANTIANYLLVEQGTNAVFDTLTCAGGRQSDDVSQVITGAAYTNTGGAGPFTATLTLTAALLPGHYRLLVCGTTSIEDLAFNKLNGGADSPITFTVTSPDTTPPTVISSTPANGATLSTGPTRIIVNFSEDVIHDGGANAANATANYLLMGVGPNAVFDTLSCVGGLLPDDVRHSIASISYDNNGGAGPFTATLTLGAALLPGHYRLLVCGTTSIEDLAFNKLNGGTSDTHISFTVKEQTHIPSTGFTPGMSTTLSAQPAAKAYADEAMWLEIPSLGVKEPVVGVPRTDGDWDVSWLGRQVGWLDGTSFPTWAGNTVLAGHSYDALGKPGPFVHLGSMQWGDWVIVHAWGQEYVYSVRTNNLVDPADATLLTKHEDTPWITLVTCQGYNEHTGQYKYRSIVRAVLIKVQSEP